MKIQNTLTQPELEMVLQFCTYYPGDWREGQKLFNAIAILKPDLTKEIRATTLDPFLKDIIPAEIYAAICPDPPRMPEGFECPCCGRLLDELEADEDLRKDEPKEIEVESTDWEVEEKVWNKFEEEDFSW